MLHSTDNSCGRAAELHAVGSRFRYSFICQGTSTRRRRRGQFRFFKWSCHLFIS